MEFLGACLHGRTMFSVLICSASICIWRCAHSAGWTLWDLCAPETSNARTNALSAFTQSANPSASPANDRRLTCSFPFHVLCSHAWVSFHLFSTCCFFHTHLAGVMLWVSRTGFVLNRSRLGSHHSGVLLSLLKHVQQGTCLQTRRRLGNWSAIVRYRVTPKSWVCMGRHTARIAL